MSASRNRVRAEEITFRRSISAFAREFRLTPAQEGVLTMLVRGTAPKEMATALGVTHTTVRRHAEGLHRKCGTKNQIQTLALFARRILESSMELTSTLDSEPTFHRCVSHAELNPQRSGPGRSRSLRAVDDPEGARRSERGESQGADYLGGELEPISAPGGFQALSSQVLEVGQ